MPGYDSNDPYSVDIDSRIADIQAGMRARGIDVYLATRIRTMSFLLDAFVPWRSYMVIPAEGLPTVFTFVIDSARLLSETWMDEDHVRGYFGAGGADQIDTIQYFIDEEMGIKQGRRELLVLVVREPSFGRIGGHPGLVAQPALLNAQLVVDEELDYLYLVGSARPEVGPDVVLVHPCLAEDTRGVYHEGEEGGQPLRGYDDVAPPRHERIDDKAHRADSRAQVDVYVALPHPGLDVLDALFDVDEVGVILSVLRCHRYHLPR